MLFVELAVASLLIVVAGSFLTRYGDRIAEKTGLGQAWVGLVLLAAATSLPELVTCLGAVTIPRQPDLVFGDVLGSNAFNLLIVVLLDLLCGRESVLAQIGRRGMLSAALGAMMMLMAMAPLVLMEGPLEAAAAPWVWTASPVIFVAYLLAMRLIFRDERVAMAEAASAAGAPAPERRGVRRELVAFACCAAVILGAGLWLSDAASRLAVHQFPFRDGTLVLGHTFVGALLLAVVTSLPELVVTISAFVLGAHAMALGNLLGSNIFNVAILALSDAANWIASGTTVFRGAAEPLKPTHSLTALVALLMTAVLMIGLAGHRRRRRLPIGWESGFMALIYVAGLYLIFRASASY